MQVIRFHEYGGPDVLRLEDGEIKNPGPNEVRIKLKAIGLNRSEALMRMGKYIEKPMLPAGLGFEASGLVDVVGSDVNEFAPGDAVSIIPAISMVETPTYAEFICVPAHRVVKHPPELSWEEAAALWMQYLTAYGALIEVAKLQKGEKVAITAASSSVGLAAIQITNMVGATPIAITRKAHKKQALLDAGAASVIVTDEEELGLQLNQYENDLRIVLDPVGGPIFEPLTAAMKAGGILIEYGGLSQQMTPFPLSTVLGKSLTLRGYLVHEITGNKERLNKAKMFILDGLKNNRLRPIIAKTFPFSEMSEAHKFLESNEQFGKVVVRLSS